MAQPYSYRVYNVVTRKTFTVSSIKELAEELDINVSLDTHDNWFYHNLLNMTAPEYVGSDIKDKLIFHWNNLVVVRDPKNIS